MAESSTDTKERQLPKLGCGYCKYYHHSEGDCRRHAPRSDATSIILIDMAYFFATRLTGQDEFAAEKLLDLREGTRWPQVSEEDFCGEFQRGSAMTDESLEYQTACEADAD